MIFEKLLFRWKVASHLIKGRYNTQVLIMFYSLIIHKIAFMYIFHTTRPYISSIALISNEEDSARAESITVYKQIFPTYLWIPLPCSEPIGNFQQTAGPDRRRSTPRLLTSIVIHQSKAIISLLMKFQFAFSAFHVDIFHIATVLW